MPFVRVDRCEWRHVKARDSMIRIASLSALQKPFASPFTQRLSLLSHYATGIFEFISNTSPVNNGKELCERSSATSV